MKHVKLFENFLNEGNKEIKKYSQKAEVLSFEHQKLLNESNETL